MELPIPCLMLVTDRHRCGPHELVHAAEQAVAAGIDAIQLREKDLQAGALFELALELRRITAGHCALIINDRLDVALAAGADGVHLPEQGLPLSVARLCPKGFLVGRSVHSISSAHAAESEGASYLQLGTIYETESKPGLKPAGLELIRATTAGLRIPCFGVGGIDASKARDVLAAGAQGVAVVSAILQAENVPAAVRSLRASLSGH